MGKNKTAGIIALGLAAWAYWKYKLTPEQKEDVKGKVKDFGNKVKDKANELVTKVQQETKEA